MNEDKQQLCQAEVTKNLVLADMGKPLTLPLSILNRNCEFKKKWNEMQRLWYDVKEIECRYCKKVFETSKKSRFLCSPECKLLTKKRASSEYSKTPEAALKRVEYSRRLEVIARLKERRESPKEKERIKLYNQCPEVIARQSKMSKKRNKLKRGSEQ